MNIFVTDPCPRKSAIVLPDKHINKMGLESCQMLSIIASKWYHKYGTIPKKDGTPYKTDRGAFRHHPCTIWAAKTIDNAEWLIQHGLALCDEFKYRFHKKHSCLKALKVAQEIFPKGDITKVTPFVRAMDEHLKFNKNIDTFTAYKRFILSKGWVVNDYQNAPERKPDWIP